MSPVTGGRFGDGGQLARDPSLKPGPWTCPTCQQTNVSALEDGCPQCGAGTAEEMERARLKGMQGVPDAHQLEPFVVDSMFFPTSNKEVVCMGGVTPRARLTLARALACYAEQSLPSPSELTRAQCLGWARVLAEVDET